MEIRLGKIPLEVGLGSRYVATLIMPDGQNISREAVSRKAAIIALLDELDRREAIPEYVIDVISEVKRHLEEVANGRGKAGIKAAMHCLDAAKSYLEATMQGRFEAESG